MKGRLVILSGPSGVGKDTVIDRWNQLDPRVHRVVAFTTREPRPLDRNGFEYHFVTATTFHMMARAGDFLEWKEVHGSFYATPLREMEKLIEAGCIAVLKIDVQGAIEAMAKRPDATSIMLLPPTWDELERRIRERGTDSPAMIEKRLQNAREEMAQADLYQHRVVNDDLEQCVAKIMEIVG